MLRIIITVWLGLIGFALLLPIAITICVISAHRARLAVMLRGIPIWALDRRFISIPNILLPLRATVRKAILMSALLRVSKRTTIQFRNLPRMQIPIGMSAPSKAFSLPSAHIIQMTENILILQSLFIPFKKHEATLKIWLLLCAARDTQKVSRANSSMMSNDFGRTL